MSSGPRASLRAHALSAFICALSAQGCAPSNGSRSCEATRHPNATSDWRSRSCRRWSLRGGPSARRRARRARRRAVAARARGSGRKRAVAAEQRDQPRVLARVGRRSRGANSRSRMASEFTATRIWKPSRGSARSSAGVASSRRKSAMATRSSEAVGRSCAISGPPSGAAAGRPRSRRRGGRSRPAPSTSPTPRDAATPG